MLLLCSIQILCVLVIFEVQKNQRSYLALQQKFLVLFKSLKVLNLGADFSTMKHGHKVWIDLFERYSDIYKNFLLKGLDVKTLINGFENSLEQSLDYEKELSLSI